MNYETMKFEQLLNLSISVSKTILNIMAINNTDCQALLVACLEDLDKLTTQIQEKLRLMRN